jgi:hypothetical protein
MVQPADGALSRKEQTMKQRLDRISFLVTALAALALSGPARAGQTVPFKDTSSGVVETVGFSYPYLTTLVVGEGNATHLGHFTVTAVVIVDVSTPCGAAEGDWTLIAANGDTLQSHMTGCGIDAFHGFGDFTVTGGTGRFQGATGHYTSIITFTYPVASGATINPYVDVAEGAISSPGSNR